MTRNVSLEFQIYRVPFDDTTPSCEGGAAGAVEDTPSNRAEVHSMIDTLLDGSLPDNGACAQKITLTVSHSS